jgi:serine/threonine protein kinase
MDRVIGTMLYMAPEVMKKKPYDEKSDMWAIGIVIFVMLTGRIPYKDREPSKLSRLVKKGEYD